MPKVVSICDKLLYLLYVLKYVDYCVFFVSVFFLMFSALSLLSFRVELSAHPGAPSNLRLVPGKEATVGNLK